MRARLIALTTLLSSTVAASASAQGFSLNRFDPAERGSEWFVQDTLDLRGHLRPAIGVTGDWAHKPLVSYAPDGSERTAVVRDQVFVHVGASLVLVDRIRFGLNVPVAVFQQGTTATISGVTYSPADKTTLGDVRLGGDVRLVGEYGSPFTLAFGVQVFVPTGIRSQWTGDGRVRVVPRLQAAGDIGPFVYAARIGAAYRALEEDFAGSKLGSELTFGASAGARVADKNLVIGPEISGTTVFNDAFMRKSTPFELILGAHYTFEKEFRVGAGVGPGLTRGFGAPQVRALFSFEWAPAFEEPRLPFVAPPPPPVAVKPPPPPPDRDHDGIIDSDDACPDLAGIKSDDPKKNGCPPDGDNDGIYDVDDACPTVPGVKSEDPKKNGCPPDKDGDGIVDPEDACPDIPGPKNEDPKKNGCPAAAIVGNKIQIWQQVKFKTNSAEILKESDDILEAVAKILTDHPEIKKIRVDGHTDNKGAKAYNKTLSKNRSASVVKWLITKGKIDKKRLDSAGFGDEQPLDSNDSDEGRQNNRRVEFTLIDVTKPGASATAP